MKGSRVTRKGWEQPFRLRQLFMRPVQVCCCCKTRNKEKQRKQPLSSNPKIETIQMCCFLFILLLLQYSIFYTGKSERDWKRSISAHPLPKNIHSICQVLGCTSQSQNSLTTSIDRVRLKEQKSPEFLGSDSSVLVFDGSRWRSGWSGRVQGQDG